MFALRVDDGYRNTGEQTQGDKTLLAIGEPIVLKSVGGTFKYLRRVNEIKAMSFQIASTLRPRPGKLHATIVYTRCSGVKYKSLKQEPIWRERNVAVQVNSGLLNSVGELTTTHSSMVFPGLHFIAPELQVSPA